MTGDRLQDDEFENDDDLLHDDEFIIEFDEDEESLLDVDEGTRPAGVDEGVAGGLADFAADLDLVAPGAESGAGALDAALSEHASDPLDLGGATSEDGDSDSSEHIVFVDSDEDAGVGSEQLGDPDDFLFEDEREGLAGTSEFGAELGPQFDRESTGTYSMEGEVGMADESMEQTEEDDAIELDLGDEAIPGFEDEDGWCESTEEDELQLEEPALSFDADPAEAPSFDFAAQDATADAADEEFNFDLAPDPTAEDVEETAPPAAAEFGMRSSTADLDLSGGGETFELGIAQDEPVASDEPALDDDWAAEDAPLDGEEYDPIYGEDLAGSDEPIGVAAQDGDNYAPAAQYDDEVDYSEYEEAYADGTPGTMGQVVGAADGGPKRSRLRLVASLAAIVPIAAAATIAVLRPEWIPGLVERGSQIAGRNTPTQNEVLIDRVAITRPDLDIEVPLPQVAFAEDPGTPSSGGPTTTDPETTDPTPTGPGSVAVGPGTVDPGTVDPGTGDPGSVDPGTVDPGTVDPSTTDPETTDPNPTGPVAVIPVGPEASDTPDEGWRGEFVAAGEYLIAMDEAATTVPRTGIDPDLRPGSQAFAAMHNGADFEGTVTRIEPASITLALSDGGEVQFRYDQLETLAALHNVRQSGLREPGYVRLLNRARLFGLMQRNTDGSVTLTGEGSGRVTVPPWQIHRIGLEAPGGVRIIEDGEDEDWLRNRIRTRNAQRATPIR